MGQRELEAALRQEGEVNVRKVWQEAELEAKRIRDETEERIRALEAAGRSRREAETGRLIEESESAAQRQARKRCLTVETGMLERLRRLAVGMLPQLAGSRQESLFSALADEVPPFSWRLVKVHPRDEEQARQRFAGARIVADDRTSGGLEVQDEEGRVTIVNTLEKRLENIWAQLAPELLKKVRQRAGDDETAEGR